MEGQKIILTQGQKEKLVKTTKKLMNRQLVMEDMIDMIGELKEKMWKEIKEIFPTAIQFAHPEDSDWYVVLKDNKSE